MPADAKTTLLRQIRDLRAGIDPAVLKRAEEAARNTPVARAAGVKPAAPPPDMEPYDKQAARDAVMQFLHARNDRGQFAQRLMDMMKKGDQAAQAYTSADRSAQQSPPKGKRV
ncbi:hypothetical protein HHL28_08490 [Aerophototrophica crusticola]|uniref:Uncharacterized protein n=1 Tax=Aerophototrophica crusticola TaxID=1709002 RepID=A0A858R6X9_9PROT|nr:hypothetical protein HHL28_08490 [Rhodospirillaceae bacterium B3]